jgi:hypothetical protein
MTGSGLDAWRGGILCLAVVCSLAAGCGEQEAARIAGTPDPSHAQEVARDPYALTCRDLARQPLHMEAKGSSFMPSSSWPESPPCARCAPRGRSIGRAETCTTR